MGEESTRVNEQLTSEWKSYEPLKRYLVDMGRKGEAGLMRLEDYPVWMSFNTSWHETLEDMRQESRKGLGIETFALVGVSNSRDRVYLPKRPVRGRLGEVPSEVVAQELDKARRSGEVGKVVGMVHSHSGGLARVPEMVGEGVVSLAGISLKGLNPLDFYALISQQIFFAGLVEHSVNYFAFKSKESVPTPSGLDQWEFGNYWFTKFGGKLVKVKGVSMLLSIDPRAGDLLAMGKAICAEHNLALYEGEPKRDLRRIYPESEKNKWVKFW